MDYETVIGLEVHVELQTDHKLFCRCPTRFGQPENSQTCPVCRGLPGSLPVLNRQVVDSALRLCLAAGCRIDRMSRFDRKNYVYPDLPKGYQITQWFHPIGRGGSVCLTRHPSRVIRIRQIHMEEDAARLITDPDSGTLRIDYNRCGIPLLEIVTEPDLRSAEEATDLIRTLREMVRFLDVSDGRMEQGSLRADVNVSVRPAGWQMLGPRTEMKNLNSLAAIDQAIRYESRRQTERLQAGLGIEQETRRWDEAEQISQVSRNKETAADYRYFPEPDLPPVVIEPGQIEGLKASLPELASVRRDRYIRRLGICPDDAFLLTTSPALSDLFDAVVRQGVPAADTAGWLLGEILQTCRQRGCTPAELPLPAGDLAFIIGQVNDGRLNRTIGRRVLQAVIEEQVNPHDYIETHQLATETDRVRIQEWINTVLRRHPASVRDYLNGKTRARTFMMGQIMRLSGGRADPEQSARLLEQTLAGLAADQRQ